MSKTALLAAALSAGLAWLAGDVVADDQIQMQQLYRDRLVSQDQEPIYGSQLMTPEERDQYQTRLRAAQTPEERRRIREEHHELMKKRAKERGVTLPGEPRDRDDRGMGPGAGPRGMEPGDGMGPGGRGGH